MPWWLPIYLVGGFLTSSRSTSGGVCIAQKIPSYCHPTHSPPPPTATTMPSASRPLQTHKLTFTNKQSNIYASNFATIVIKSISKGIKVRNKIISNWCPNLTTLRKFTKTPPQSWKYYTIHLNSAIKIAQIPVKSNDPINSEAILVQFALQNWKRLIFYQTYQFHTKANLKCLTQLVSYSVIWISMGTTKKLKKNSFVEAYFSSTHIASYWWE